MFNMSVLFIFRFFKSFPPSFIYFALKHSVLACYYYTLHANICVNAHTHACELKSELLYKKSRARVPRHLSIPSSITSSGQVIALPQAECE